MYLLFGDYEYSCYMYLHTDFCVNTSIRFTWVILRSRTAESDAKVKVKSLSRVRLFATPWTVAYQALPSMGFSRQEYWSRLPLPSPEYLLDPGSPALSARHFTA